MPYGFFCSIDRDKSTPEGKYVTLRFFVLRSV